MSKDSSREGEGTTDCGGQLELPLRASLELVEAKVYVFPKPLVNSPSTKDDALRRILDFAAKLPGK